MMLTNETIVQWTGADGNGFRLHGPGAGREGVVLLTDPKEIYYPPFDHKLRQTASGRARWVRANTTFGSGGFTVDISPDGPGGLQACHDRWMRSWSPYERGWFSVFTPGVGWWYRRSRLVKEDFTGPDPLTPGYGVQLDVTHISDDGAWFGFPDTKTWTAPTASEDKFVAGFISLPNRGQMNLWPRYLLPGPGQWRIADADGAYVVFPMLEAGESIFVDTDEQNQTVVSDTGASRWPQTRGRFTLPVAPTVNGNIEMREIGVLGGVAGQVATVVLTPMRRSPW